MRTAIARVLLGSLVCSGLHGLAAAVPLQLAPIVQLKDMHLETVLAVEGRSSCTVVVPDDPAYLPLARKVADAVKACCGAAPAIRSAQEVLKQMPPRENLIALGVFANNPVVEDMYLRQFVLCDYSWPGGEKSYVIRTVHNPWLNGKNVIYLGASSLDGCRAAVERFAAILSEKRGDSVGPTIEVMKDGRNPDAPAAKEVAAIERQIDRAVAQDDVYGIAARTANNYFITGQPAYGRLFLQAMRKIDHLHETQADVAAPAACQCIFQWFDCIEEGDAFSNEERLELTNLLYRFAARLPEARTVLKPLDESGGNRNMAPAFAALYFSRYYPDLDGSKRLLANMDTFYAPDMKAWKPPEDSPHYANLTVVRSIHWALQRPHRSYFDEGLLRKIADYYMLISNNSGQLSGIGDYVGLGHEGTLVEAYPLAAWLYRDGRYLWWWDRFAQPPTAPGKAFYRHRGQGLMGWVPPEVLPRKRPDDLLGIARAPLDRWIYDRRGVAGFLGCSYEESHRFPIDACYDKVSFRAGFERTDQYLCLSGFSWGYHSHPDANAIVNYSDLGQTILYDDGYMIAQPSEHNTVIVLKDGWTGGIPELAQMIALADFPRLGLLRSRLNDYSGVDWDRSLIWAKSRYFLVIDTLAARQPAHYSFQCIWRALGETDLQARRWQSRLPAGRFHLIACSDARLVEKPSAGTNLNSPPMPLDEARRLVQSDSVRLDAGASYQLANLFYSRPAADSRPPINVCRLDKSNVYMVEDEGRLAVAGIDRCDNIAGLSLEAEAFHLLDATLTAAGLRRIQAEQLSFHANTPVNVQLDLADGVAQIDAAREVTITFAAAQTPEKSLRFAPGRHAITLPAVPATSLQQSQRQMQGTFARLSAATSSETASSAARLSIRRLWEYHAGGAGNVAANAATDTGAVNDRPSPRIPAETAEIRGSNDRSTIIRNAGVNKSPHPNAVRTADLDGDGRSEILVAGVDNAVHAITPDGRRLWRREFPDSINDLNVTPDAPAKQQVVIGCNDDKVYSLATDGVIAWSTLPPAKSYARPGYREGDMAVHQGKPVVVLGTDLDGDGHSEVIVGVNNGFVYAFDQSGKLLWDAVSHTPHSMTCGAAFDLDGDGRPEIVMGNIYGYAQIFSSTGKLFGRGGGTGHAGAVVAAAGDADGDGKGEVVVGDKLGKLFLQRAPADGIWSAGKNTLVYNTGSDITAVAMADVNGDGRLETVAASKNFLVYLFDADGKPLWHANLGDFCLDLDVANVVGDQQSEIVCACEDGTVQVLDAAGQVLACHQAPSGVRSLRACELDGNPQHREIVVGCQDGTVCALQAAGR